MGDNVFYKTGLRFTKPWLRQVKTSDNFAVRRNNTLSLAHHLPSPAMLRKFRKAITCKMFASCSLNSRVTVSGPGPHPAPQSRGLFIRLP